MFRTTLLFIAALLLLASCLPAPAMPKWEGEPTAAPSEFLLNAEARDGYTRFNLITTRDPIDRVQWLVTGTNVQVSALDPRQVSNGTLVEVSEVRTAHRLVATGDDLCVRATFSYQGSNQPLFLEGCEAELLTFTPLEQISGQLKAPGDYSLRGNPDFSEAALNPAARAWYQKVWVAIEHPENYAWATSQAASDNIYNYSRGLYTHLLSLLTVFRITGDLELLDEISRLTQIMRSQLADGWRDTLDGTSGRRDGYLNWVDRFHTNSRSLYGKDLTEYNEARAHSILAMIAYALELNRDLISPAGINYGSQADFWKDYLINHFEAKWRQRNGVGRNEFPFIIPTRSHTHSSVSTIMYHYYMYKLTGRRGYLTEVQRQTNRFFNELRIVNAGEQDAFVWRRHMGGESGDHLMPAIYARYVMADALNFHLEGIQRWSAPSVPVRFANTLAHIMMDNGATDLARDVGGGIARAGYAASSSRDWDRISAEVYIFSPFALLAPWDSSGKVARISKEMFENVTGGSSQYRVYIPAGMFLYEMLR